MKKLIYVIICLFLLSGCANISNTPTKQVESFFYKYQTLDSQVLNDLNNVIDNDKRFDETTGKEYQEIIKKQYRNMTYKIKDETIDGDKAVVTVEIIVLDLGKIIKETENYKNNHIEEFKNEDGNYDEGKYINYLIPRLKGAKEKVRYTFDINLTKIDKKWKIDGIDSETEDKILGVYEK